MFNRWIAGLVDRQQDGGEAQVQCAGDPGVLRDLLYEERPGGAGNQNSERPRWKLLASLFSMFMKLNHKHVLKGNDTPVVISSQSLERIKSSIKQESLGDGGQGTAVCSTDQVRT